MTKTKTINIFSENIHPFEIDESKALEKAKKIISFYLKEKEVFEKSCLFGFDFDTISFDILYCGSEKTHEINKEYRQKDYAADIITFAIFADSEEKFIFDGEVNLGEIIISLEKVKQNSDEKGVSFEQELYFLIAHGIMHLLGFDHQTNEDYNFIIAAQTDALNTVRGVR